MSNVPNIDNSAKAPEAVPSRRSFLTRAAGVSAIAVPTLTLITSRKARAAVSKKLTGLNAELINEVMDDEDAHVPILQGLLNDPDNPLPVPIRKTPNLNFVALRQPNLQAFLETASAFENTGSGLYHGALLNITQTQEYFPIAAGLAAVESRHASWLNSLLGESLVPDFAPVEAPIAQSTVLSRVTPFVTDPRATFPSFDTTVVSDANNFFILDFVLFLEYIESAFYNLNVPLFT
ncbi:MAG TPA: ferritin-like domain-containing protein [Isosphaeraceae bacterium]|nr:ferritin-like domain-containing protein [Isosphaeraceae bacterium]